MPERIGTNTSAIADVRVKRGSTWMIRVPRSSRPTWAHFHPHGWFSAGLAPMTRMQSLFLKSRQWFVIAPRPKLAAKLATVGPCQTLACCSM